jgi:hypothetical protein
MHPQRNPRVPDRSHHQHRDADHAGRAGPRSTGRNTSSGTAYPTIAAWAWLAGEARADLVGDRGQALVAGEVGVVNGHGSVGWLAQLDDASRQRVEQLAVVAAPARRPLVEALPGGVTGLARAEQAGMVRVTYYAAVFRHELARRAILAQSAGEPDPLVKEAVRNLMPWHGSETPGARPTCRSPMGSPAAAVFALRRLRRGNWLT